MKKIKLKYLFPLLIISVFIVLFTGYVKLIHLIASIDDEDRYEYNSLIGQSVNLNGDTLIITSANWLLDTYGLSNGTDVDSKIIEEFTIKTK